MILENDFPPDDRVEKEALSLIHAGHEVHIACLSRTRKLFIEDYKSIIIYKYEINQLLYKLSAALIVLPFYFIF